jgi:hypothetical protein
VPVGVHHARHHDAAGRVDLSRPVRDRQPGADRGDRLAGDEHVGVAEDRARVVHRQHGRVPEDNRLARLRFGHGNLHDEALGVRAHVRTIVR